MTLADIVRARISLLAIVAAPILAIGACYHDRSETESRGLSPTVASDPKWSDPRSATPEAMVYRTWQAYLASKSGSFAANAGTPSRLWVADEQKKWPMYDLAGFYLPDSAVPHVMSIHRTDATLGNGYEIVTRFTSPGARPSGSDSSTVLTMTTFARQKEGQWRIANALHWKTRSWYSETVGQVTYYIDPTLQFNRARAIAAVAFIDSLASAFEVPRLGPLDYYVASSVDIALDIIGVDYPVTYGPTGGFSKPANHQLFSGIPALGEEYRHELTHLVLRPLLIGSTMTVVASEGVATWFGGTSGSDFNTSVKGLAAYLRTHRAVSLDSILGRNSVPQADVYAAGAVLCAMLADHGGVRAVKAFLVAGPGAPELKAALARLLGRPWAQVVTDWREQVDRIGRL